MFRRFLSLLLVAAGLSACTTPDETLRATAYSEIARAQMVAGDAAGARRTVELALQAIDEDDDDNSRDLTIAAVAVAHVRAGDPVGAEKTVRRVGESETRGIAYAVLALAMAEAGHREAARRIAILAGGTADARQSDKVGSRALALVAWVLARTGDLAGAREAERKIAEADIRAEATALIARSQAEAGDATGAESALNRIRSPGLSGSGMEGFMIARGMAVDVFDVFDDFFLTAERSMQHSAWHATAQAFAKSGDMAGARRAFDRAINTADAISKPVQRIKLLAATALAQAEVGDRKAALATLIYADSVVSQAGNQDNGVSENTIRMLDSVRFAITGRSKFANGADPNDTAKYLIQTAIFQIRLNDPDGASGNLDRVRKRQAEQRDRSLLVGGLGRLAVARIEAGDRAAAQKRAAQALEIAQGIPRTEEDRIIAMFFASVALARTGNIKDALAAAAEIQEKEEPAK